MVPILLPWLLLDFEKLVSSVQQKIRFAKVQRKKNGTEHKSLEDIATLMPPSAARLVGFLGFVGYACPASPFFMVWHHGPKIPVLAIRKKPPL
ncbi:MAG: hypothetical protein IPN76_28765 [Saprospiraceae bacterium]|nr:hypothetical protein [Saprospiraceae bacterium]